MMPQTRCMLSESIIYTRFSMVYHGLTSLNQTGLEQFSMVYAKPQLNRLEPVSGGLSLDGLGPGLTGLGFI